MKRHIVTLAFLVLAMPSFASSLGTAARSVIPVEVQQVINVDYRKMKGSDTAMAMKAKLLPPNMKQFEDALKSIGVVPDRDLEEITLASFHMKDHRLETIGIAQGQFTLKNINLRLAKKKIKGEKSDSGVTMYSMPGGMSMTFLDDITMLFGNKGAVEASLEARDTSGQSLNANGEITDMINSVDQGAVWSVLAPEGTQNMMRSAMGAAAGLAEFDTVKKQLLGSFYRLDFDHGVDFNLNVVTADAVTAATLSSLLKAGILFRKMNASPA